MIKMISVLKKKKRKSFILISLTGWDCCNDITEEWAPPIYLGHI